MRIKATTDFKHGRLAFAKDGRYEGPEGALTFFVMTGWAEELPDGDTGPCVQVSKADLSPDAPRPASPDVTLEVQDLVITTGHVELKNG